MTRTFLSTASKRKKIIVSLLLAFPLMIMVSWYVAIPDIANQRLADDPKLANLKLPDNFKAERLYSPGEKGQGSWVAMTFDNKGRMIASSQFGNLYRLSIPPIGADTAQKVQVEKLEFKFPGDTSAFKIGFAHGLLYAFNSLYVMVNDEGDRTLTRGSGLYRLQDTDNDDQYDKITLLKALDGRGEHGPHSIVLAPDKKSIYVVAGNFTRIPEMNRYRAFPADTNHNLAPLIKDPNGHDNTVAAHGGWIAHVDSSGRDWELVSAGFRNSFDLAFNEAGDMFTYDSDMEWDFGTPWYRPTRICHVTSGSEFGWRPGTLKWSPSYADNLPAVINIGQGSPTSFFSGQQARFPEKYRKAFYAFDWSFGIIYAIHMEPDGATYKAKGEEFISGSPLPLTDGIIGPDGAMYFLTGGRRLESDLYRVSYNGNVSNTASTAPVALNEEQRLRRQLETYHERKPGAVDFAWPHLKHKDRFIRYAARIAIQHQPVEEWQDKLLKEKDPVILSNAMIAFARQGDTTLVDRALQALMKVNYKSLNTTQQLDYLRAFELLISYMGMPANTVKNSATAFLNQYYPANNNELNRQLSKLLLYMQDPLAVKKTMALMATAKDDNSNQNTVTKSSDLILRNLQYGLDIAGLLSRMPPAQQTYYANVLSQAKTGWTPALQEKYFKWFKEAFAYKGGVSFVGFIEKARKNALAHVPQEKQAYFNTISGSDMVTAAGNRLAATVQQPQGPGKRWTVQVAQPYIDSGIVQRDFDKGKAMFSATLCSSCHTIQGEGGAAGPDLTQIGKRFSYRDMIEAITDPSKTISDQYASVIINMKDGSSVLGRIISETNDKYTISQNPFAPQITRDIRKRDVVNTRLSNISAMPPGLINRLNPEELKDLLAYLKAGGNKQDTIFSAKKAVTLH
jgi:putative heme-binding domain-containing protein